MPTRKLRDLDQITVRVYKPFCYDREHHPPTMQVFENGVYEHECPTCHHKTTFVVCHPTL